VTADGWRQALVCSAHVAIDVHAFRRKSDMHNLHRCGMQFETSNGNVLHYEKFGSPDAAAVLLIHGKLSQRHRRSFVLARFSIGRKDD
jgi:hypothetical protein